MNSPMNMRNRLVTAGVLAATVSAAAQQLPAREAQATGTGVIRGLVVEAGTDRPVQGAQVSIYQTRGEAGFLVAPRVEQLTDGAGAFEFRNLPVGQFSVAAHADGYQPGAIGKRRPQGEETWVTLKAGQTFSHATIELFRGGTISGTVTNDRGEPMNGGHIDTWLQTSNGHLKKGGTAETNAAGAYRISTVAAGDHLVVALVWHHTHRQGPPTAAGSCSPPIPPPPPGAPPRPAVVEKPKHAEGEWFMDLPRWIPEPGPDDRGNPRTILTTMYSGVSEWSQASPVSIREGEERTGIDLQFRPVTATTVQGRIVPLPGEKIGNASEVRLRLPGAPPDVSEHTTRIQPDNTFRFLAVSPGPYVIEVQLQEASCDVITRNSDAVLTALRLDVPPTGLDGVIVPMSTGVTMQGRIRFDGKTAPAEIIEVWLTPRSGDDWAPAGWNEEMGIIADGLIPGSYALQVSQNGEESWYVHSMTLGRLDLVTHPFTVDRNDVSGVEVTMTDRPSPLEIGRASCRERV